MVVLSPIYHLDNDTRNAENKIDPMNILLLGVKFLYFEVQNSQYKEILRGKVIYMKQKKVFQYARQRLYI